MREESNHAKIDLEQVLIEGDKNRQTDQSLVTVTVLTDSMTVLPFHIPPTSPNWFNTMSTLSIFLVRVAQTITRMAQTST